MVVLVVVVVVWVAFGGVAAAVSHRSGHDTFPWALAFLALGPLALPLAVTAERHGGLEVLVVLYGEPGAVLQQYATEHGYEVNVMENSSPATSHLPRRGATHTSVPFLVGPAAR